LGKAGVLEPLGDAAREVVAQNVFGNRDNVLNSSVMNVGNMTPWR
jgi:hypothetical protein